MIRPFGRFISYCEKCGSLRDTFLWGKLALPEVWGWSMAISFKALGVSEGDCFLLQDGNKAYLVDGGKDRNGWLPGELKRIGVSDLTAAACTHTDADHMNGIIDLMQNRFPVSEYWLPDSWPKAASAAIAFLAAKGAAGEWVSQVRKSPLWPPEESKIKDMEASLAAVEWPSQEETPEAPPGLYDAAAKNTLYLGSLSLSSLAIDGLRQAGMSEKLWKKPWIRLFPKLRKMVKDSLKRRPPWAKKNLPEGLDAALGRVLDCLPVSLGPDWSGEGRGRPEGNALLLADQVGSLLIHDEAVLSFCAELVRLARATAAASAVAAKLRFFDYQKKVVEYAIKPHPFTCVNGKEVTAPVAVPPDVSFQALMVLMGLSTINIQSRVFRFNGDECKVLYCADSNFSFVGRKSHVAGGYSLSKPAIVTAPHHGSSNNDNVYQIVNIKKPGQSAWIRSDRPSSGRPGAGYKGLPKKSKYCTTCAGSPPKTVEFKFDRISGEWQTTQQHCCC